MDDKFSLEVTRVFNRQGLMCVEGRWLTGPIAGYKHLVLERTQQKLVALEVGFGDGPVTVLLTCGPAQDVVRAIRVGDRLCEQLQQTA